MKLDIFVKATLVVIALFLGIIALRPLFEIGSASANPDGKFDYVQFSPDPGRYRFLFFDSRTGDIWGYSNEGRAFRSGRLVELGKPIQ